MSRNLIGQQNTGNAISLPGQMVQRFDNQVQQGSIQNASNGKYVQALQPIDFTPANRYMEEMNAVANVGEGIFNAAVRLKQVSEHADKSARDAYLANVETDDIVQTNRIYNENAADGNNPELLATKLGQYRDGKRDAMPAEIQPYYTQSFNKRAAVLTVNAQDAFFQKAQSDSKASLEGAQKIIKEDIFANPLPKTEIEAQAYEDKIAKFRSTVQSRIDHGFITPEEAQLEQKDFQKNLIVAGYKSQLETMGPNARAKTIFALQQNKGLPAGLNVNDKQEIVNQLNAYSDTIESTKKAAFAQENAAAALQKSRMNADLEIRVARGEATYEEVQQAESKQQITPEKKATFFKALDTATETKITESNSIQKMARVLDGKEYIDPKNPDDKKAVDLAYTKTVQPQMAAMQDPAAQKSLVTNFVQATGVVPESLRGKMRGVFRGGTVNDKVFYADLIGRIQESKPQALDDFDDKDITQAVMIDQLVKSGTPNEEAVLKVENITNNITPGRIETLKAEYQDMKKAAGTDVTSRNAATIKHVSDLFDEGVFSKNATLPDRQLGVETAAINDYDRLYETWYLNTNGNTDLAKQQADRVFKNSWGTTAVNGQSKQLTKYPIEQAYPKLDAPTIKQALMLDLATLPEYKEVPEDKVFVQYDNRTAREWGTSQPKYRVLIQNTNGLLEPISDPAFSHWAPDHTKIENDLRVHKQMGLKIAHDTAANAPYKQNLKEKIFGLPPEQAVDDSRKALAAYRRTKTREVKLESVKQKILTADEVLREFGKDASYLGDKIFSVFVSDAGAAEPSAIDLQQFASKENLSEDQLRQVMVAQNKQIQGSYSSTELKVMPALIKNRYYRSPPSTREVTLDNYAQFEDLSEKEVRNLMLQQNQALPGGYTAKEIEEQPARIVARYYRRPVK